MDGSALRHHAGNRPIGSLRAQGLVVIALPFVVVLVNLALAGWFDHVNHDAQAGLARAQQALVAATTVQGAILDFETEGASYLLSGPNDTVDRHLATGLMTPITGELRRLSTAPTPSPAAARATARASSDMKKLLSVMGTMVRATSTQQLVADVPELAGLDRHLNSAMIAVRRADTGVIASEQAAISSSSTALVVVSAVAVLAVLLGGVTLSLLFTSRVVERLRQIEDATDTLAAGGEPGDLPDGADELGRLGRRLRDTATLIRQHEEAHRRDRANLDDVLSASPVVAVRFDSVRRTVVYASPNIGTVLGVSRAQVTADADRLLELFHPDDVAAIRADARAQMAALGTDLLPAARAGPVPTHSDDSTGRSGHTASLERTEHRLRFRRFGSAEWGEASAVVTVLAPGAAPADGAQYIGPVSTQYDVAVYLVDVSERRRAEAAAAERRHLIESIFDASPDIIVVWDLDDQVVVASRQATELLGAATRTDEAPDRRHPMFAHSPRSSRWSRPDALTEGGREEILDLVRRCRRGDPDPGPVVVASTGRDGTARVFEVRARPVTTDTGIVTGTVTVSRDVTDRVELEHSLRRASEVASAASTAKSEFLSRMSHELRTPLNAILGFTQLMQLDELPPDQTSSVEQIQRAGQHLLALINEVLDIARIESGHVSLSLVPVGVAEDMAEVMTLLAPVAESQQIELRQVPVPVEGVVVEADRQRLLQVLLNLGSNAVKYNAAGGMVVFETVDAGDGRARIAVTDDGPGIPAERHGELFVPFSRLGAERSGIEGTGVGLALTKQLAELMGGDVGVVSAPGEGATFWVELRWIDSRGMAGEPAVADSGRSTATPVEGDHVDDPAYRSGVAGTGSGDLGRRRRAAAGSTLPSAPRPATGPTSVAAAQTAPPPATVSTRSSVPATGSTAARDTHHEPAQLRILYIEDNESNLGLVARVLARRPGVELLHAPYARLGLDLARRHRPDLILLDLHLPDLPGDEVLYRLRADPDIARTRVVVVSADATPSRVGQMLALGVDAYLTKPIDVAALLRLVDVTSRRSAAQG